MGLTIVGALASGCKRECTEEVPKKAVVASADGLTRPLGEEDALYVCPGSGATVSAPEVVAYVGKKARVYVQGTDVQVFAEEQSEIDMNGPNGAAVTHPDAEVKLNIESATWEKCQVTLKVPPNLQVICDGEPPPATTGDTGTTPTTSGGGNNGSTNGGGNGGNGGGTQDTDTGYVYYYIYPTADTGEPL